MLIGDLEENQAQADAASKTRRTAPDKPRQQPVRKPLPKHLPRETPASAPCSAAAGLPSLSSGPGQRQSLPRTKKYRPCGVTGYFTA
jgi:hypothetical protein